ncbi:MAG: DEAD/DEAH box helicase [Bacteroidetes bacterium]|nr:DEAD/DEAH box helicase [Bacteroidota bacterium]
MEKKKEKKKKVSYHRQPTDISIEDWQRKLREQFAEKKEFKISNIGNHQVFSDFLVNNPRKGSSYKVAIRGENPGKNFCSCYDFKINYLGTCKHIEAVLFKIKRNKKRASILKRDIQLPYTSVFINYIGEQVVKIRIGTDQEEAFQKLSKEYFDEDNTLTEIGFGSIEKFIEQAKKINNSFRIYSDAFDFILKRRSQIAREQLTDGISKRKGYFDKLIKTKLYAYQREGVLFAARAGRSMLADDMGLGKTIQAIAVAELYRKELNISKVLIISPTSLKYQWKNEIHKFSESNAKVVEGNMLKRQAQYSANEFYKIISYGVVKNDLKAINETNFDLVILDEAQRIKNWETQTARYIKWIQSKHVLVLTGTPLENKLEELYSVMQVVDPFKLGPLHYYLSNHQIRAAETGKVIGYKDLNLIKEAINDVVLRRTKKKVLKQLPKRQDKVIFVPMTETQMKMHGEFQYDVCILVNKWRRHGFLNESDRNKLLINLNCMRMVSDSTFILDQQTRFDTKVDELMNILENIFTTTEEKVVIFSQWERMTRLVAKELDNRKIKYENLHGSIPSHKREALFTNFNSDEATKVFLSTDAGGVGLNLQSASYLINLDLPWNPAVLEQRIGRIHRIGQKKNISVINLVSKDTIEERMLDVIQFKKSLSLGILDNGESSIFMGDSKFKRFMKDVEKISKDDPSQEKAVIPDGETNQQIVTSNPTKRKEQKVDQTVPPVTSSDQSSSSADKIPDTVPNQYETLEEVMQQGMAFLSGMMKMATGSDLNMDSKTISVNKETGEVVMKFKLPKVKENTN